MMQKVGRWGGMRAARRMSRAVPFAGGLMALAALASTIRSKGAVRGTLDAALTAIPLVGGAKTAWEVVRGRDLLPDRPGR
ncbi:MAG: hypothetical protein EHM13_15015 [Acidobacteria bacterium]|nr:MAG: hypothetical protein EHM13_15015 [Acidobacteriota bacterium]